MQISGHLLVPNNPDFNTSVTAVNCEANGQTLYVVYVDSNGSLKAGSISFIPNIDGSLPRVMSGCTIIS